MVDLPELSPTGVDFVLRKAATDIAEIAHLDRFRSRNNNYPRHVAEKLDSSCLERVHEANTIAWVLSEVLPGLGWRQIAVDRQPELPENPEQISLDDVEWPPR